VFRSTDRGGSAAQIFAVELDQVEGTQHRSAAIARPADQIKHRAVHAVPEIVRGRVVSSKQAPAFIVDCEQF
jgi:hypothetical protein